MKYRTQRELDSIQKDATLQQISSLTEILHKNENIAKHWVIEWDKFNPMSFREYRYILDLLERKRYIKLNQLFERKGILRTEVDTKCPW